MAAAGPTKDDFVKAFQEWDGAGMGLLNEKQIKAALSELTLPFTANELAQHIAVGKSVSGDSTGKIKLQDFATYLSFEVAKKKAMQPAPAQPQQQQQPAQSDNPFDLFGFDDNKPMVGVIKKKPGISVNVNNGQQQQQQQQQGNGSMVVTVTPVSGGGGIREDEKAAENQRAMRNMASPTQQNEQELPDWFGHSLASPVHGNAAQNKGDQSPWDIFGFDDNSNNNNNNNNNNNANANANNSGNNTNSSMDNGFMTPATPNVQYAPETPAHKRRNSQPKASTPGGLIAPPRQGNRSKSPKSKTRPSSPQNPNNNAASDDPFDSWGQANENIDKDQASGPASGSASPNDSKKPKKKKKAKKSYDNNDEEEDDQANNNNKKTEKKEAQPQKKKRHKTDAIAQMKRGTAMLKYGRHGFPHFRRFQLSKDNRRLLWYSRKKSLAETHIEIKDIKDVLEGQQTEVFKQCTQRTLKKASFSIIYGAKLKTLDVVAKSQEEAQLWTKGLKGLMKANKVGKLHKVVQILVDVPYVDITKPKGKEPTRDPNSKQQFSAELIQTIEHTLRESKKTFEIIVKLAESKNVLKSSEYENVSVLVSEIEQRLNEVETGLNQKNVDFIELKRDVWVLKVDVTVLEEKLKVLSKGGSAMYL